MQYSNLMAQVFHNNLDKTKEGPLYKMTILKKLLFDF